MNTSFDPLLKGNSEKNQADVLKLERTYWVYQCGPDIKIRDAHA